MKKIIIPVLAMAMQSSCGGGYTRYGILCCTTSFQGGDDEEGTYGRGEDVYKNNWAGAGKVGNGINAETIATRESTTTASS